MTGPQHSDQNVDTIDGRRLWCVTVRQERTKVLWVLGDRASVKEDADDLAFEIAENEWDDVETDWKVDRATAAPSPDAEVWTGGPDGTLAPWGQIGGPRG